MKNLKKVLLLLLVAMVLPISSLLTGCGATPKNEVLGVFFHSPIYDDETGHPVFAVDQGIKTQLTYKINPSSWSGYEITYRVKKCSAQNLSRFTLEDGKITVGNENFEDIEIEILVNGYVDTCIVTLKKYPTNVYVEKTEITIPALGNYTINPIGDFVGAFGATYKQALLEYDYNFVVESSDPTIISVPNPNRLKICSVRKNNGSANVTVKLLNSIAEVKFTLQIKVNVIENAGKSVAMLSGYDNFVNQDDTVSINASSLEKSGDVYKLKYDAFVFSPQDLFLKDNVEIVATTNSGYARVKDAEKTVNITKGISNTLEFEMFIWTNITQEDGTSYSMDFKVIIDFTK